MPRFVYKIEPVSLIPDDAEYIFESEQELKPGDVFERTGVQLFVEDVVVDEATTWEDEPKEASISKTLHCRLVVD